MTTRSLHYPVAIFLVLGCWPAIAVRGDDGTITPEVAGKFGTVIEIEAEFVPKPNDYFAQNMVNEPYYLKVLSVNGNAKRAPITIEYSYFGNNRIANGVKYRFKAYETIYTIGNVRDWDADIHQCQYYIVHKLMIKDAK